MFNNIFFLKLILIFQIIFITEAKSDDNIKLFNDYSNAIEKNRECDFQNIDFEAKKIDKVDYFYYLKNIKENKSYCDHIYLAYQSITNQDFYDFSFSYLNAKRAIEINENRNSLPYIIQGIKRTGNYERSKDYSNDFLNEDDEQIDTRKAELLYKKALDINSAFTHLVFAELIYLQLHLVENKIPDLEKNFNKCFQFYLKYDPKKHSDADLPLLLKDYYENNLDINNNHDSPFWCLYEKARLKSMSEINGDKLIAFEIFKVLSDVESLFGHAEVADIYCNGHYNITPNVILGKTYLEKGISLGAYSSYINKYEYLGAGKCGYELDKFKARELLINTYSTWKNYKTASMLADDFFFGYGGHIDKDYAIKIVQRFLTEGDIDAMSDLAYYHSYDSGDNFYNLNKAIQYLKAAINKEHELDKYLSFHRYQLAFIYLLDLFDENQNLTSDEYYSNGKSNYQNIKLNYFESLDDFNKEIIKLFSKSCIDGETASCEHAALIFFYGLNGVEENIQSSAFYAAKIFINNDMEYTGFIPEITKINKNYTSYVKKFIKNLNMDLENKQRWFIGMSASNYKSESIIDIPQAGSDNQAMGIFFEEMDYLSYWYDDVDLDFYKNLNSEIKNLIIQGELISNINNSSNRDLVLYFSGHAIAYNGKNYILPIDIQNSFSSFEEARPSLISLDKLINKFSAFYNGTMIIIIDACRTISKPTENNNKNLIFKSNNGNLIFNKSSHDGLAPIDAGPNKLIVFASEAGKPALFSMDRENSFFTEGLLEALNIYSDDNVEEQISLARKIVSRKTNGLQTPVSYSTLINEYYLN